MSIKLGTTTASLYLGSTPVAAYLGAEEVYSAVTVPGAPTVIYSLQDGMNGFTELSFAAPASDGGSAITGYKIYFDGVETAPDSEAAPGVLVLFTDQFFAGQQVQVSAVNAVGEGPKSSPVTVSET